MDRIKIELIESYLKNIFKALIYGIKALFYLVQSMYLWKTLFQILFIIFFWEMIASIILFILMIPAILEGDIPIWLAIIAAILMGIFSGYISKTYDYVNPIRRFYKKLKNNK